MRRPNLLVSMQAVTLAEASEGPDIKGLEESGVAAEGSRDRSVPASRARRRGPSKARRNESRRRSFQIRCGPPPLFFLLAISAFAPCCKTYHESLSDELPCRLNSMPLSPLQESSRNAAPNTLRCDQPQSSHSGIYHEPAQTTAIERFPPEAHMPHQEVPQIDFHSKSCPHEEVGMPV